MLHYPCPAQARSAAHGGNNIVNYQKITGMMSGSWLTFDLLKKMVGSEIPACRNRWRWLYFFAIFRENFSILSQNIEINSKFVFMQLKHNLCMGKHQ